MKFTETFDKRVIEFDDEDTWVEKAIIKHGLDLLRVVIISLKEKRGD